MKRRVWTGGKAGNAPTSSALWAAFLARRDWAAEEEEALERSGSSRGRSLTGTTGERESSAER